MEWESDIIAKSGGTMLKFSKSQLDEMLSVSPSAAGKILNRLVRWECYEML